MPDMLLVGMGGAIAAAQVIAVASLKSAPVQRMLKATPPERIIDLTYGYPRLAVIVLSNGFIAISSRTSGEIARVLHLQETDDAVPWW